MSEAKHAFEKATLRMALNRWNKQELVDEIVGLNDYVKILLKRLYPEDCE